MAEDVCSGVEISIDISGTENDTSHKDDEDGNHSSKCTSVKCIQDEDIYKLECYDCKRRVHYKCTKLPAFQVQLFLTKHYRRFVCVNCIDVPEYLSDLMPSGQVDVIESSSQTVFTWSAFEELKDRCENAEDELRIIEDELERILNEKQKIRSENAQLKQSVKTLEEHQELLRKHLKTNEDIIKNLKLKSKGEVSDNDMEQLHVELDKQAEVSKNHRNY